MDDQLENDNRPLGFLYARQSQSSQSYQYLLTLIFPLGYFFFHPLTQQIARVCPILKKSIVLLENIDLIYYLGLETQT